MLIYVLFTALFEYQIRLPDNELMFGYLDVAHVKKTEQKNK